MLVSKSHILFFFLLYRLYIVLVGLFLYNHLFSWPLVYIRVYLFHRFDHIKGFTFNEEKHFDAGFGTGEADCIVTFWNATMLNFIDTFKAHLIEWWLLHYQDWVIDVAGSLTDRHLSIVIHKEVFWDISGAEKAGNGVSPRLHHDFKSHKFFTQIDINPILILHQTVINSTLATNQEKRVLIKFVQYTRVFSEKTICSIRHLGLIDHWYPLVFGGQ
jgi:hypothetical protein